MVNGMLPVGTAMFPGYGKYLGHERQRYGLRRAYDEKNGSVSPLLKATIQAKPTRHNGAKQSAKRITNARKPGILCRRRFSGDPQKVMESRRNRKRPAETKTQNHRFRRIDDVISLSTGACKTGVFFVPKSCTVHRQIVVSATAALIYNADRVPIRFAPDGSDVRAPLWSAEAMDSTDKIQQ